MCSKNEAPLRHKKGFFSQVFLKVGEQNTEQIYVYAGFPCKITVPTDKNSVPNVKTNNP
jgi:hypothetical protein